MTFCASAVLPNEQPRQPAQRAEGGARRQRAAERRGPVRRDELVRRTPRPWRGTRAARRRRAPRARAGGGPRPRPRRRRGTTPRSPGASHERRRPLAQAPRDRLPSSSASISRCSSRICSAVWNHRGRRNPADSMNRRTCRSLTRRTYCAAPAAERSRAGARGSIPTPRGGRRLLEPPRERRGRAAARGRGPATSGSSHSSVRSA